MRLRRNNCPREKGACSTGRGCWSSILSRNSASFAPSPLAERKPDAAWIWVKTAELFGTFDYSGSSRQPCRPFVAIPTPLNISQETSLASGTGVCRASEAGRRDSAPRFGCLQPAHHGPPAREPKPPRARSSHARSHAYDRRRASGRRGCHHTAGVAGKAAPGELAARSDGTPDPPSTAVMRPW